MCLYIHMYKLIMFCSASLTHFSSCDRGFTGPTNQLCSRDAVKTVPEALAPRGHRAHPDFTGNEETTSYILREEGTKAAK